MILVLGTVKLAPERLPDARAAMERMVTASRAEDGCLYYSYAQDVLQPETIHVIERWRDHSALQAHFATAHMAEWRGIIGQLGLSDRNLKLHEIDEGVPI
jgi:quinol monooxygenase YgiN